MKNAFIVGIVIAVSLAIFTVFHFVHPIVVLTIGDIFWMIIIDVFVDFFLALYLGDGKNQNMVIFWTIVGSACLAIPIIAALIKYNRNEKK